MQRGEVATWSRRPSNGDLAVAGGFAAVGVALTVGIVHGPLVVAAVALSLVHCLALAWRCERPAAVLAVMAATGVVALLAGWPAVIFGPAVLAAVHGLGLVRDHRRAWPLLAGTAVATAAVAAGSGARVDTLLANTICLGIAWYVGDRQRQARVEAALAEQGSESRASEAVAAERLRIARELHDIVAHTLSTIAVQAGSGRVVIEADTAAARRALANIEGESRSALAEMRRLLDVLRSDDDLDPGPRSPSPGLDDLEALVATTVRDGLPVDVHIEGERAPLPAGAELAAYRIVQEALTNVRRHASATRAQVRIAWQPTAVDVEVRDDGRGSPVGALRAGHGLIGMRERVALYGGTLEAADSPGGGFRVAAHIPCGDRS